MAKKLQFEVFVPRHGCFQAAYDALVAAHLSRRTDLMPPLNQLGIASRPETTVQTGRSTPSTKPFYYRREELELGRGTFGVVYMVRDVSDGQDYAAKQFFGEVNKAEVSILADLKHVRVSIETSQQRLINSTGAHRPIYRLFRRGCASARHGVPPGRKFAQPVATS